MSCSIFALYSCLSELDNFLRESFSGLAPSLCRIKQARNDSGRDVLAQRLHGLQQLLVGDAASKKPPRSSSRARRVSLLFDPERQRLRTVHFRARRSVLLRGPPRMSPPRLCFHMLRLHYTDRDGWATPVPVICGIRSGRCGPALLWALFAR